MREIAQTEQHIYNESHTTIHALQQRGRVVQLDRGFPLVLLDDGSEIRAQLATALIKTCDERATCGDWVLVELVEGHDMGLIVEILPRTCALIRKDPSERTQGQVLAANFDAIALFEAFPYPNFRRIERALVLVSQTDARCALCFTKSDCALGDDLHQRVYARAQALAPHAEIFMLSREHQDSFLRFKQFIAHFGLTVFLGPSGVGKSTLINRLVGNDIQQTGAIRERDGRGRHTTVARRIVAVPSGGTVMDMPGVRGLAMYQSHEAVDQAFSEIDTLAQSCKFSDCSHTCEPGCAVRDALLSGRLSHERFDSYLRLREESIQAEKKKLDKQRRRSGHPRRHT